MKKIVFLMGLMGMALVAAQAQEADEKTVGVLVGEEVVMYTPAEAGAMEAKKANAALQVLSRKNKAYAKQFKQIIAAHNTLVNALKVSDIAQDEPREELSAKHEELYQSVLMLQDAQAKKTLGDDYLPLYMVALIDGNPLIDKVKEILEHPYYFRYKGKPQYITFTLDKLDPISKTYINLREEELHRRLYPPMNDMSYRVLLLPLETPTECDVESLTEMYKRKQEAAANGQPADNKERAEKMKKFLESLECLKDSAPSKPESNSSVTHLNGRTEHPAAQ